MLYDQMALLSPSVAFSWSRWNAECKNADTCVVLASEHLNYERPVNEVRVSGFGVESLIIFILYF